MKKPVRFIGELDLKIKAVFDKYSDFLVIPDHGLKEVREMNESICKSVENEVLALLNYAYRHVDGLSRFPAPKATVGLSDEKGILFELNIENETAYLMLANPEDADVV